MMISRRTLLRGSGYAAAAVAMPRLMAERQAAAVPAIRLEIAPYALEVSRGRFLKTIAYNGRVPGPLLRMTAGIPVDVEIRNTTATPEIVHWHGLGLPPELDGAMEVGTPMIAPGATVRQRFTPDFAGFRWFHTHTFAGKNLKLGQYTGQHGFLMVAGKSEPGRYDREFFLALHDWEGQLQGGDDGSMEPAYEVSTINGRTLGFGEPLRVKQGERVLLHVLNSSATDVHWVALAGHSFEVVALDGNALDVPKTVGMLRLAPAERVCAVVTMDKPGVWVFGEVRKHVQEAGMGIVVEYAGATGKPQWVQPKELIWSYGDFVSPDSGPRDDVGVVTVPIVIEAKFHGHASMDEWLLNGAAYPQKNSPVLHAGQRTRLLFDNRSEDDHPLHLHRHIFRLRKIGAIAMYGPRKDVVLVPARSKMELEFVADNPGATLLHCHQQNHMDMGFMMVMRYA